MKEVLNKNDIIAINDGSLDYVIKEKPVEICMDAFSDLLSERGVEPKVGRKGDKCFSVRILRGYSKDFTVFLREEVEECSGRSRFLIQKESVLEVKGLMVENGIAVQAVGIDGLRQKNVDVFAAEALCDFANCASFASFK